MDARIYFDTVSGQPRQGQFVEVGNAIESKHADYVTLDVDARDTVIHGQRGAT